MRRGIGTFYIGYTTIDCVHIWRARAEGQGNAKRIAYHQGDFVELAPHLPQADIVTLEKVIVHPTEAIEVVVRAHGLERRSYRTALFWQVIVCMW